MPDVPPVFLDQPHLKTDSTVSPTIEDGSLIVDPKTKLVYALAELLAASNDSPLQSPEERDWLDAPVVGGELI